jgi:hypothetical protein
LFAEVSPSEHEVEGLLTVPGYLDSMDVGQLSKRFEGELDLEGAALHE